MTTTPSTSPTITSPGYIVFTRAHDRHIHGTWSCFHGTVPNESLWTRRGIPSSSNQQRRGRPASIMSPFTPLAINDRRDQLAEHPSVEGDFVVTTRTSPGWRDFDSRMNHQIIASLATDRDRRPSNLGRVINRPHVGRQETNPSLSFVYRGDALFASVLTVSGFGRAILRTTLCSMMRGCKPPKMAEFLW